MFHECPQVINAYRIATIARDAVRYRPLAGETLRRVIAGQLYIPQLAQQLLAFDGKRS